jgi:hypothetical protein
MEKRYEIFISSTFKDLTDERQIVRDAIVRQDNFPNGMELFYGGRPPWNIIEKAINSCDYYILIVGGRYGSIKPNDNPEGLSFTECEYRLACKLGKEILPLILSEEGLANLPKEKREIQREGKTKLERLRKHLKAAHRIMEWTGLEELRNKLPNELSGWIEKHPVEHGGWIRLRELKKEESQKQIFNYLFNRLNPYEDVSLTLKLIKELDQKLDSIADVINVLEWLIKTYVEELIDAPIRVYFAYSLNPSDLAEAWKRVSIPSNDKPRYRLGISNSKDGKWREGNIIEGASNIHNVYRRNQILWFDDSTKRMSEAEQLNIPVEDEASVIAAPVYALSSDTPIGVVGINSAKPGEARNHRGLVKELSALFSSLFYAYGKHLEKNLDLKKPTLLDSVRTLFKRADTLQTNRKKRHFIIRHLRKEIAEHFGLDFEENTGVIK